MGRTTHRRLLCADVVPSPGPTHEGCSNEQTTPRLHRLVKRDHRDATRGGWSVLHEPEPLPTGGEEQDETRDGQGRRPEQIEIDPATAEERQADPLVDQHGHHPGHDERGEGVHADGGQRDRQ